MSFEKWWTSVRGERGRDEELSQRAYEAGGAQLTEARRLLEGFIAASVVVHDWATLARLSDEARAFLAGEAPAKPEPGMFECHDVPEWATRCFRCGTAMDGQRGHGCAGTDALGPDWDGVAIVEPVAPVPEAGPYPPRKGDVWQTQDGCEWVFNGARGFRGDTMEQTTSIASHFDGYGHTGRAFSPEAFRDGTLRFVRSTATGGGK